MYMDVMPWCNGERISKKSKETTIIEFFLTELDSIKQRAWWLLQDEHWLPQDFLKNRAYYRNRIFLLIQMIKLFEQQKITQQEFDLYRQKINWDIQYFLSNTGAFTHDGW